MASIYKAFVNDISEEQYEAEIKKQTTYRLKSISQKNKFEQKGIITGYILLRRAVNEIYNTDEYTLKYVKHKPVLPFCNISLSRSGKLVVLAISDRSIGVDSEAITGIKKRNRYFMFTDKESYYVNRLSHGVEERYWEIYSKKYAYVKMMGYNEGKIAEIDVTDISGVEFKTEKFKNHIITYCEKIVK